MIIFDHKYGQAMTGRNPVLIAVLMVIVMVVVVIVVRVILVLPVTTHH